MPLMAKLPHNVLRNVRRISADCDTPKLTVDFHGPHDTRSFLSCSSIHHNSGKANHTSKGRGLSSVVMHKAFRQGTYYDDGCDDEHMP